MVKKILNKPLFRKIIWLSAILWSLIIFIACTVPGKDVPKITLFDHFDKVVHFVFFFIFFFLWKLVSFRKKEGVWIILSFSVLYGYGLELYQMYFTTGRSFDLWDLVADGAGAICAAIFFYALHIKKLVED